MKNLRPNFTSGVCARISQTRVRGRVRGANTSKVGRVSTSTSHREQVYSRPRERGAVPRMLSTHTASRSFVRWLLGWVARGGLPRSLAPPLEVCAARTLAPRIHIVKEPDGIGCCRREFDPGFIRIYTALKRALHLPLTRAAIFGRRRRHRSRRR